MQVEKLYELSRRILLLDRRQAIGSQIVSLIQEIFRTESVARFDGTLARLDATGSWANDLGQLARNAYFQDSSLEDADANTWSDVLRLGSKPIGAVGLRGPELDRLTIVSIASLAAIALERVHSTTRATLKRRARPNNFERRFSTRLPTLSRHR